MKAARKKEGATVFSILEVNRKNCTRCHLCVEMCPLDVLRPGKDKFPFMRYPNDCWYCDVCVSVCPRKALTLKGMPYLIR